MISILEQKHDLSRTIKLFDGVLRSRLEPRTLSSPRCVSTKSNSTMMKAAVSLSIFSLIFTTPSLAQDDCVRGTQDLVNNLAVVAEFEAMITQINSDVTGEALTQFCKFEEGSIGCQVNVAAYSSNVISVCQSEGGTSIERDVLLTCSGQVQGVQIPSFEFNMFNIPVCVDTRCDTDNLPTEVETIYQDVVDGFVMEIESAADVECDATTTDPADPPTSGGASVTTAVAPLLAVLSVAAFSWIIV